jgi:hypothetical protein
MRGRGDVAQLRDDIIGSVVGIGHVMAAFVGLASLYSCSVWCQGRAQRDPILG